MQSTVLALSIEEQVRYALATGDLFAYVERHGIRRTWLAERLDVSRARLWNWEHGLRRMPLHYFDAICRVLEVTPERFGWVAYRAPRRKAS